jgi:glycine cleavage system H protein
MVALLVVATFVAFITIDYLLHREKYNFRVAEPETAGALPGAVPVVAGVALPDNLAYHPGHTWALDAGNGRVRVGLDEFAASLLGRIGHIEVPQRGRWFRQGDKGWTVTTPNGQVPMLAPAEGEIVGVNDMALANPEAIARDPYGAGWILEIFSPDVAVSMRNLLAGSMAKRWMEESVTELRRMMAQPAAATSLDGGRIAPEVGLELPPEMWKDATQKFFRY